MPNIKEEKNLWTGLNCMYSKALLSVGLNANLEWLHFCRAGQSKTQQKSAVLSGRFKLGASPGAKTVRGQ